MRVAGDHLEELVGVGIENRIVDTSSVGLTELKFAALGDKATRVRGVSGVDVLLVIVADGCAIDDDRSALQRLVGLELRFDAELQESAPPGLIYGQACTTTHEIMYLGTIGHQRGALVKRDLVDPQGLFEVGKKPDERLPDGPGPHDVHDALALRHLDFSPWVVLEWVMMLRTELEAEVYQPRLLTAMRRRIACKSLCSLGLAAFGILTHAL